MCVCVCVCVFWLPSIWTCFLSIRNSPTYFLKERGAKLSQWKQKEGVKYSFYQTVLQPGFSSIIYMGIYFHNLHKAKSKGERKRYTQLYAVQFSSVAKSLPTLCHPMNRSTPGLPVHHQLPEFTQTHVHRVDDAIQPSHPLSSPSPPALNLSQHQVLFKWVSSSHQVAKGLEFQLQHVFPMNIQHWFPLGGTGWISLQSKGLSRVFSNTTIQKHQFFGAQISL